MNLWLLWVLGVVTTLPMAILLGRPRQRGHAPRKVMTEADLRRLLASLPRGPAAGARKG